MARPRSTKETEVVSDNIGQAKPIDMGELGKDEEIQRVAENDFVTAAELENFMNDKLTIIVAHGQKGSMKIISPNVNGLNQPIIRGLKSKVKRKYVEVLARTRTETFTQVQRNPNDRSSMSMVPESAVTYPFTVINDPRGEMGREWLEGILAQV